MIKINLLSERKPSKAPAAAKLNFEGAGNSSNFLLIGILLVGVFVAGGWWWTLSRSKQEWETKIADARVELERLKEARAKGEEFEKQKALLSRKIDLITSLKKQQAVPVHILDQVSRNLPDFLWLDAMSSNQTQISIQGKATTYTAVSNFYSNLSDSGFFENVALGRTFEVPEGVSFSLTCSYAGSTEEAEQI